MRMQLFQVVLHDPIRAADPLVVPEYRVAVFDDAADLYVGKRERFLQDLDAVRLYYRLLVNLAVKGDDASIRPDGSGVHLTDVVISAVVWNLNRCVLLA